MNETKTQQSGADAGRPARPQLEICICAAIVAENGEIIRGHRHMDCLRTAGERSLRQKPGHEYQGFVTSRNRYVDRKEAAALQLAAGVASADPEHPYLNGECYSEDLYAALAVPSSSVDQAVRQISEAIRTPVHSEAQQDGDHFTHRLAVQASAPATHDPRLIDAVAPALRACAEAPDEPTGTYNCPICGWNVPHSEHATEMMTRLAMEKQAETDRARTLAQRLVSVATFVRSLLGAPSVSEINALTEPYGCTINTSRD